MNKSNKLIILKGRFLPTAKLSGRQALREKKKHSRERGGERERGRPENANKIHHRKNKTLLLLRKHT